MAVLGTSVKSKSKTIRLELVVLMLEPCLRLITLKPNTCLENIVISPKF